MIQICSVGADTIGSRVHAGGGDSHFCNLRAIRELVVIVCLPRDCALFDESRPSLGGNCRDARVVLCLIESRLALFEVCPALQHKGSSLRDLLIEIRRSNYAQYLAGVDAIANVHHSLLQVAIDASKDRRLRYRR